jgi:hypothetical protein
MIKRTIKLRPRIHDFCKEYLAEIHGPNANKKAVTTKEKEHLLARDKLDEND